MKTYVINLKRCPERKFYMEQLLAKYPFLDVEFIEAVDGKSLSEEEKNKRFDQNKAFELYGKYLSDGEIGCTLSHQLCYSKVKNGKEDCALILEDDLFISDLNIHQTLKKLNGVLRALSQRSYCCLVIIGGCGKENGQTSIQLCQFMMHLVHNLIL